MRTEYQWPSRSRTSWSCGGQRRDDLGDAGVEVGDIEVGADVADGPAEVGGIRFKSRSAGEVKRRMPQVAADHDDRDVDAAEQVEQVVVDPAQLVDCGACSSSLTVDSSSLADCISSLAVCSSSLVLWSSSLLERISSLARLELLGGRLVLLDDRLEILARGLQLAPQLDGSWRAGHPRRRRRRRPPGPVPAASARRGGGASKRTRKWRGSLPPAAARGSPRCRRGDVAVRPARCAGLPRTADRLARGLADSRRCGARPSGPRGPSSAGRGWPCPAAGAR